MNSKFKIDQQHLLEVQDIFKMLSNINRLKILYLLDNESKTVNELVELLGLEQSAVSHQLRILRDFQLVSVKQVGKTKEYRVDDPHIFDIINEAVEHSDHVMRGANHGE
ncbi:helix-turn-helix transcriptional regulator [Lactobacillus sp. Sy-1]|uniref:ArsR/SmtB family transcription factor n=1 Tax=Lactobacillus sp. Sy-1 TaxID=2109645 RepID=UPI001C5A56DE|nr:metalloregulator ArsR/SmtB family transcription factor [Lactobacillus sp. Sy-1]MBW1605042.1 winged helix-turn-helix transcriptional regulator [Lactobacillus sp. Sy-1]